MFNSQDPHGGLLFVPNDLMQSYDLHGQQAHMWYTDIYTGITFLLIFFLNPVSAMFLIGPETSSVTLLPQVPFS